MLTNVNDSNKKTNLSDPEIWVEYQEFIKSHELQLYAMGFPVDKLGEKLYYKLKYEVFENNIFKVTDNQEIENYFVQSNIAMKKNSDVFLIDHCWTLQIRQFYEFTKTNPDVISRVFKMLKYSDTQKEMPKKKNDNEAPRLKEIIHKYQTLDKNLKLALKDSNDTKENDLIASSCNIKASNEFILKESYSLRELQVLKYDDLEIDDHNLNSLFISKDFSYGLSLTGNKITNINLLVSLLLTHQNIKILWIDETNFNEDVDVMKILSQIKSLEIINDTYTSRIGIFTAEYLENKTNPFSTVINSKKAKENTDTNTVISSSTTDYYLNKVGKSDNIPNYLDLSYSGLFNLKNSVVEKFFDFMKERNTIETINISKLSFDSDDELVKENYYKNISLLLKSFPNISKLVLDLNISNLFSIDEDQEEGQETERIEINNIFKYLIENYSKIKENNPKLKYINDFSIEHIISFCYFNNKEITVDSELLNNSKEAFTINDNFIKNWQYYLKINYVQKYMWRILGSYRFITSEKFDENITWYFNDEIGSAINMNHSDNPNVKMFPFIFSKTNNFETDAITYSIVWPDKDIKENEYISKDNLINIDETQQRSAKLTLWYDTPQDYFKNKFFDKLKSLEESEKTSKKEYEEFLFNFSSLEKKIKEEFRTYLEDKEKLNSQFDYLQYKEEICKIYDFTRLNLFIESKNFDNEKKEGIIEITIKNIIMSILDYDLDRNVQLNSQYLIESQANPNKQFNVLTDLDYVKSSLSAPYKIVDDICSDVDICWLNMDYYQLNPLYSTKKIEAINTNNATSNNLDSEFTKSHFKNQFPFEAIVCMKFHLTKLIQETKGICPYYGLSYNLDTELAEFIGNFYYNEDPVDVVKDKNSENTTEYFRNNVKLDNSWILKPINMARAMDMIVSSNLAEIIKSTESGPKICQKYIHNPYLINKKKFDFRYMVIIKSLAPVEIYIYTKVFWFRTANNDFRTDTISYTDYETHFTVMNYNKKTTLNQIFDHEFLSYLKERGVEYKDIYNKLCEAIKEIFINASRKCPQMIDAYAKAIYGIDVMIDESLQPKILEFNFSPDCTRAVKYTPSFYQDIFNTIFLNQPTNVELI